MLELPKVGHLDGDGILNAQPVSVVPECFLLVFVFPKSARRVVEVGVDILKKPGKRSSLNSVLAEIPKSIELLAMRVDIENVPDLGDLVEVFDIFRY